MATVATSVNGTVHMTVSMPCPQVYCGVCGCPAVLVVVRDTEDGSETRSERCPLCGCADI